MPPKELIDCLKKNDKFIIATHFNPDGDTLGSAIALSNILRQMGKETILLCRDNIPQQYMFLPGQERFYTFRTLPESAQDFKNLILVDCNDIDRIIDKSRDADIKVPAFEFSIVIDHHETEKPFGDVRWIEPHIAATGIMIFHLSRALESEITKDIATNLYAAIVVDTGNFRFSNTTPDVLHIAAELADAGAEPSSIYGELNESWSDGRFRLFIRILDTLEIQDGIAITTVTKKMFDETSTSPEDTENFVAFPRIMRDVKVSALFREVEDNMYKVSLRAKGGVNVARIAEAFGGGGHRNAAGCTIKTDLTTAKKEILDRINGQR
jgi:phosphoesterase RecJ-like protein